MGTVGLNSTTTRRGGGEVAEPVPDVPVEAVDIDAEQVQVARGIDLGKDRVQPIGAGGSDEPVQGRDGIVARIGGLQFREFLRTAFDLQPAPTFVVQQVPGVRIELAVPRPELDAIAVRRAHDLEDLLDNPVFAPLRGDLASGLAEIGRFRFDPRCPFDPQLHGTLRRKSGQNLRFVIATRPPNWFRGR